MRERLTEYSHILQLDTATMLRFKYAPDGLIRALQMFAVVTLIAGLGLWLGIPVQLERPVLYEELDGAQTAIDSFSSSVEPFLAQNIPFLEAPENVAALIGGGVEAAGEAVNELLALAETEAETLSPPLGTTASRVIRVFGNWISVPYAIIADWLFVVLVAMLVAKMLGGRGTLDQHLTAVFLSAAPLILLLPSYIPYLGQVMPITFAYGISLFSNLIAVIGFAWAALILIKGLGLAHEFSWWRATAVLVISWFVLYVLLPLAGIMLGAFILPF